MLYFSLLFVMFVSGFNVFFVACVSCRQKQLSKTAKYLMELLCSNYKLGIPIRNSNITWWMSLPRLGGCEAMYLCFYISWGMVWEWMDVLGLRCKDVSGARFLLWIPPMPLPRSHCQGQLEKLHRCQAIAGSCGRHGMADRDISEYLSKWWT